jgi:hypothetical protein
MYSEAAHSGRVPVVKQPWMVFLLAVLACDHSEPFAVMAPDPLGPYSVGAVRRLTFNPGEDRDPFVLGDSVVVYTSLGLERADRDRCLGFLPVVGGTLLRTVCPGGWEADTVLDAWSSATVSRGGRLAYVRERGSPRSFAPSTRTVSIAGIDAPDSIAFELSVLFDLFGQRINGLRKLLWDGEERLTFVAGLETFPRPLGGPRDTVFAPVGLAGLDVANGLVGEIRGGEDVFAYVRAPQGRLWIVGVQDPAKLLTLEPDGSRTAVGTFSGAVVDVAVVGGSPVAAILGGTALEWLDPLSGQPVEALPAPGVIRHLSAVEGKRQVVADVESVAGRDLWLMIIP